jgi:hypothetical protein
MRLELLETIARPEGIFEGAKGELLAVREIEPGRFFVAIYREAAEDGFVITAFLTSRTRSFAKRKQLWPNPTSNNS